MAPNPRTRRTSRRQEPPPPPPEDDVSVELPQGGASFAEDESYEPGESSEPGAAPVSNFEEVAPAAEAEVEEFAETGEEARPASSGRTSASRRGRSSRRLAATSGRSSRRATLSPQERSVRHQALKSALILACGLMLVIGAGFAAWFFLIRDDPKTAEANAKLSDIENSDIHRIQSALDNQKPDDAEKTMLEARIKIDEILKLDRPKLGPLVESAKNQLGELDQRIVKVKHDLQVQANLQVLLDQFSHLADADTDLDKLEASAKAFLDNPVDWPNGVHSEDYLQQYGPEVNRIAVKMASISDERSRRKDNETTIPVQQCQKAAKNLMLQGKYQDALSAIDEAARKFPNADFTALHSWVEDDAKKSWDSIQTLVTNCYADVDAIGSAEATRKDALAKARERLHFVIDNFGIDTYVTQAKALLAKYPE